jgi:hypothetical protein
MSECVRNIGGMMLTRKKWSTRKQTYTIAILPTTNLTWIGLGSNPGLRGDGPVTNHLNQGTALVVTAHNFLHHI